jgi:hypothetical protein
MDAPLGLNTSQAMDMTWEAGIVKRLNGLEKFLQEFDEKLWSNEGVY